MLERLLGEDLELLVHPAPELWTVEADPNQMQQALVNLAVNARDAMPDGGRLIIETSNVSAEQANALAAEGITPAEYVCIEVADTGVGMDEATKARLFEPFFTTKEVGKGTGLGLATVHGIVSQSGGHILVRTELTKGKSFRIYLPRTREERREEGERYERAPMARGHETILVAEDSRDVRALVCRILKSYGYGVLEASTAEEALTIAQREKEPLALLLTDVVMPGMNGTQLVEKLTELRPGLRVLYMTGYTENAVLLGSAGEFIHKPFRPEELAKRIRGVLDRRRVG
jgi:CheY-like chemotaxis protein